MMDDDSRPTDGPDDLALLAAVSTLWQQLDPPPDGLAEGALARIAAEDLEFELLTLVESPDDALAGVRHAAPDDGAESGAWSLEYEGGDLQVHVRLTRIEGHTRLDGWVVPARPITVRLSADGSDEPLEVQADEFGRFEFSAAPGGLSRLTLLETGDPDTDTDTDTDADADHDTDDRAPARPRVTPPFWI
jgi:hypothetical protein